MLIRDFIIFSWTSWKLFEPTRSTNSKLRRMLPFTLFSARKDYALFISINASGKSKGHILSTSLRGRRRRWKGDISRGAKISRDPWKTLSSFGLFSECLMASSLNNLTVSFRSHDAGKVMRRARYLPEMSLPTLSLKRSNYTGQEPAALRLLVNPTTALLIALFPSWTSVIATHT